MPTHRYDDKDSVLVDKGNDELGIYLVKVSDSEVGADRCKSPSNDRSPVKQFKQSAKSKSDLKHSEHIMQLLDNAENISIEWNDLKKPKSRNEMKVESSYIYDELLKINYTLWFDYLMTYHITWFITMF